MLEKCEDHSGCIRDIEHLQLSDRDQWESIGKNRDRIDSILSRMNLVLGGVVVSCIMLVINLILTFDGNK